MRLWETDSASRRAGEAIQLYANDGVEEGGAVVTYPSLGPAQTPDEPATPTHILGKDIAESLKHVVDRINIVVEKIDETAKVRIVVNP